MRRFIPPRGGGLGGFLGLPSLSCKADDEQGMHEFAHFDFTCRVISGGTNHDGAAIGLLHACACFEEDQTCTPI